MGPKDLAQVLRTLPQESVEDANLLVGLDTSDDAGVYKIDNELAIVQTVDFFTPIVDDPYAYGMIAAANSLSDIYAMGAKPLTAMNLVSFPIKTLGPEVLGQILQGGLAKLKEAGTVLIGGHSIDDNEPKYGLSITGVIDPSKLISNAGAQPGDYLILTKPLGIGLITTGIKRAIISKETEEEVIRIMAALNKGASEACQEVGVNALTDVTGFGLLGHLNEMLKASGCAAEITFEKVPILSEAWFCLEKQAIPGGSRSNLEYIQDKVTFNSRFTESIQLALADAQTSGGLLIAVTEEKLTTLLDALKHKETPVAAVIGRVIEGEAGQIVVN